MKEISSAEFTCDVYPEDALVNWTFHGINVDQDSAKFETKSNGKTRHLVIHNSKEEDAGTVGAFLTENDCHAELLVEGILYSFVLYFSQMVF